MNFLKEFNVDNHKHETNESTVKGLKSGKEYVNANNENFSEVEQDLPVEGMGIEAEVKETISFDINFFE